MDKTIYKIIIVGAGAAGMMAAISAAKECGRGKEILLLEKNEEAGKKLLATGNGRCNFTNAGCTLQDYAGEFLKMAETADFPKSVLNQASPQRVMKEFARLGIPAREEEEGRVYPYSGQGASVRRALCFELERLQVKIRYKSTVKKIEVGGDREENFLLTMADGSQAACRSLILAVGGKAGCQYGSEGDGYSLSKFLGHRVVKPIPALVQLTTDDGDFPLLKGIRAKGTAALYEGSRRVAEDGGEVQFTENALSGICIFNLSRFVRYSGNPLESQDKYHVEIDFLPDQSQEQVYAFLLDRRKHLAGRGTAAFLDGLTHEKLSAVLMKRCGGPGGGLVAQLTDKQLKRLAEELKAFSVRVIGTKSWKDAQVTAGGVDTEEIKRDTLESKRIPSLYFAGELIDVDAPCGGYNLQWAFASGMVAGSAAAKNCELGNGEKDA